MKRLKRAIKNLGVVVQDWTYLARYDAEGRLVKTEILPPE